VFVKSISRIRDGLKAVWRYSYKEIFGKEKYEAWKSHSDYAARRLALKHIKQNNYKPAEHGWLADLKSVTKN
jgi:hypothetical protein